MKKNYIASLLTVFMVSNAAAEIVQMTEVPTSWKLENYISDNVIAWYTSSSCTNGQVTFPANASSDDKNRFWSVVTTGKVSGKEIFVRYDTVDCKINSFGFSQE